MPASGPRAGRISRPRCRTPGRWKTGSARRSFARLWATGCRPKCCGAEKWASASPLPIWFRGPLRELLWDSLTSRQFLERGIVTPGFVRYMLEEHQSGRRDNTIRLWMLLMLELWFQHWQAELSSPVAAHG